jgi:hypothetical protein
MWFNTPEAKEGAVPWTISIVFLGACIAGTGFYKLRAPHPSEMTLEAVAAEHRGELSSHDPGDFPSKHIQRPITNPSNTSNPDWYGQGFGMV